MVEGGEQFNLEQSPFWKEEHAEHKKSEKSSEV